MGTDLKVSNYWILRRRTLVGLAVLCATISACGVPQEDFDTVSAERDALNESLETSDEQVSQLETKVVRLTGELDDAEQELAGKLDNTEHFKKVIEDYKSEIEEYKNENYQLSRDLESATAERDDLRIRFEPEVRAQAQSAWDAEVARACAEAGDGDAPIETYVNWDDGWQSLGSREDLVAKVEQCAEPLRARSEAERLSSECEAISVDQVTKSPDELAGNCYQMFVIPWQWDSRTGECAFLGSFDPSNLGTRSWKYEGDGLFTASGTVCQENLADADQDDLLRVWADLGGSYSYDTAIGGTNEVPRFSIRHAELVSKG